MQAAQIPGTIFVLLIALAAFMNQDPDVVFILAIACACGWAHYALPYPASLALWWACILVSAFASILLLTRIFI